MRHFVCSDLHGVKDLYDKLIKYCNSLNEPYEIIFAGDACDRGPDGFQIMNEILNNPNFCYLKGNHEDMFVKAAEDIFNFATERHISIRDITDSDLQELIVNKDNVALYMWNGGESTLKDWMVAGDMFFVHFIKTLPYMSWRGKYDIVHAGCSKRVWERFLLNEDTPEDLNTVLWDRKHFNEKWYDDHILVHGHTPVQHLYWKGCDFYCDEDNPTPVRYNNKIDLDTGAYSTGVYYIFDLDNDEFIRIN